MRSRISKPLIALVVAASALAVPGCASSKESAPKSVGDAVQRAADRTEKGLADITPEGLRKMIDAVADKSGKKPARLTEIRLNGGTVTVFAVDPAKPTELNSWRVGQDAKVEDESSPVDYGGDAEALRQNTFGSDKVKTDAVVAAIKAAPAASKLADAKILGATVSRDIPSTTELRTAVTVNSPRGNKTVKGDMSGEIVSVN